MANSKSGAVKFTANDQAYTLVFSMNALCELEEVTGKDLMSVMQALDGESGFSLRMVRALLWAGLSDNHEMTLKDVGRLVEELGGVQEVVPLIEKAFQTGMPEAKKDQGAGNL